MGGWAALGRNSAVTNVVRVGIIESVVLPSVLYARERRRVEVFEKSTREVGEEEDSDQGCKRKIWEQGLSLGNSGPKCPKEVWSCRKNERRRFIGHK